jgi:hypothetical protein
MRDQEKCDAVFRKIAHHYKCDDHVYHFRPFRPEMIVI